MKFAASHAFRLFALAGLLAGLTAAAPEVLLDNDQVRVVRVVEQPHAAIQAPGDGWNRVLIYFQASSRQITRPDGRKVTVHWKAGEAQWSPAAEMGASEITSSSPVTIIEVALKKPGDPAKMPSATLDPLKVDPQAYRLAFENSQVRVTHVRMGPKHHVPMHQHTFNRVVVLLTDQNSNMTTPDGKTTVARHKAGEISWGGPTEHQEMNLSDKPLEVVVVEPKS